MKRLMTELMPYLYDEVWEGMSKCKDTGWETDTGSRIGSGFSGLQYRDSSVNDRAKKILDLIIEEDDAELGRLVRMQVVKHLKSCVKT